MVFDIFSGIDADWVQHIADALVSNSSLTQLDLGCAPPSRFIPRSHWRRSVKVVRDREAEAHLGRAGGQHAEHVRNGHVALAAHQLRHAVARRQARDEDVRVHVVVVVDADRRADRAVLIGRRGGGGRPDERSKKSSAELPCSISIQRPAPIVMSTPCENRSSLPSRLKSASGTSTGSSTF